MELERKDSESFRKKHAMVLDFHAQHQASSLGEKQPDGQFVSLSKDRRSGDYFSMIGAFASPKKFRPVPREPFLEHTQERQTPGLSSTLGILAAPKNLYEDFLPEGWQLKKDHDARKSRSDSISGECMSAGQETMEEKKRPKDPGGGEARVQGRESSSRRRRRAAAVIGAPRQARSPGVKGVCVALWRAVEAFVLMTVLAVAILCLLPDPGAESGGLSSSALAAASLVLQQGSALVSQFVGNNSWSMPTMPKLEGEIANAGLAGAQSWRQGKQGPGASTEIMEYHLQPQSHRARNLPHEQAGTKGTKVKIKAAYPVPRQSVEDGGRESKQPASGFIGNRCDRLHKKVLFPLCWFEAVTRASQAEFMEIYAEHMSQRNG